MIDRNNREKTFDHEAQRGQLGFDSRSGRIIHGGFMNRADAPSKRTRSQADGA